MRSLISRWSILFVIISLVLQIKLSKNVLLKKYIVQLKQIVTFAVRFSERWV